MVPMVYTSKHQPCLDHYSETYRSEYSAVFSFFFFGFSRRPERRIICVINQNLLVV